MEENSGEGRCVQMMSRWKSKNIRRKGEGAEAEEERDKINIGIKESDKCRRNERDK